MVSKKQKEASRKWDRENMRSLTCRLRTEEAEIFKEFCAANNTTPGRFFKDIALECIRKYTEEKEGPEKSKKTRKPKKTT